MRVVTNNIYEEEANYQKIKLGLILEAGITDLSEIPTFVEAKPRLGTTVNHMHVSSTSNNSIYFLGDKGYSIMNKNV